MRRGLAIAVALLSASGCIEVTPIRYAVDWGLLIKNVRQ
mgnify:CR=1 FL=1